MVTVSLYKAKLSAYRVYCEQSDSPLGKEEWESMMTENSDMFQYWNLVIDFGLLYLSLERSSRERNFSLYCSTLELILPYSFILDRMNYQRWLAVHVDDLQQLKASNPSLYSEFERGHFAVSVKGRPFSSIAADQGHEQTNKIIKGYQAALGSDIGSVWNLACPELIRVIKEFEDIMNIHELDDNENRHDDHASAQISFVKNVSAAYESLVLATNPFSGEQVQIVFLHNAEYMDCCREISTNLRSLLQRGKDLYQKFRDERLINCSTAFTEPMTKQFVLLPGDKLALPPIVFGLTTKQEAVFVQEMSSVVEKRFDEAVRTLYHEPFNVPAALTKHGESFKSGKSALLMKLSEHAPSTGVAAFANEGALVVDLSYIVVSYGSVGTYVDFRDFCEAIWKNLTHIGSNNKRIDIVCDNYTDLNVLKQKTRSARGSGGVINFDLDTPFPSKFSTDFLKNTRNKEKLYDLLVDHLHEKSLTCQQQKFVFTKRKRVVSNKIVEMEDSSHLEADTRIVLHILDILREGVRRVVVRSTDTDVFVILTYYYNSFREASLYGDPSIILMCGKKSSKAGIRYIDIGRVSSSMSLDQSKGLLLLFAMAGCDYVESFYTIGQKTWLQHYRRNEDIAEIFSELIDNPDNLEDRFEEIMLFVLTVYGVKNPSMGCEVARAESFTCKVITTLRQLPPSKPALFQHMRRSLCVASKRWAQAHVPDPPAVNVNEWGWIEKDGSCTPNWTNYIYVLGDKNLDPFLKLRSFCSCGKGGHSSQRILCKNCSCRKSNRHCWKKCGCNGDC